MERLHSISQYASGTRQTWKILPICSMEHHDYRPLSILFSAMISKLRREEEEEEDGDEEEEEEVLE